MKLNVFNRKKTTLEKLTSTYDVKLDASASQLIMDVLAKLYDNPVEAAIREYVSNAYDANVEAGSTEPVHLHVPTEDEPYLEVSDTSIGLDYLGIVSVFANFGTSTKRDSNEFIGGFGIGSKSGLAISDKIHVSSVCNGLLNEFVIERKDGILQTRFIVENKKTLDHNGTTVTVNLNKNFIEHNNPMVFTKYHYVIQGWSVKELIVDNPKKQFGSLNDDRISDAYHKIPNTDTWIHNSFLTTTDYQTTTQRLRIGKVLYKIPDNIVQKLSDEIYYQIRQINMVHDVPIGEFKVNYAREKLDVSDPKTVKKLVSIMKQAYKEYTREYTAVVKDIYIDAPTKLRMLRENQYPFNDFKCLEDCGINDNLTLPFKYKTYALDNLMCRPIEQHNILNDTPDIFILDDKGYSDDTYENICGFLSQNFSKLKNIFPNVHYKRPRIFGNYWFSFCDSAGLYWHINSDTKPVIKIEDILKYMPNDDNGVKDVSLDDVLIKSHNVFDMNNKFAAVELQDLPDNADTHVINDNSNDYLDKVYDFVLPTHNNKFIACTNANDEIDWILKNKPNVSYFTKADMDTRANTIATIIGPLLNNDNAMYVVKMLVKNKQLSSNISMLHLDTTQDTETYIKALYRASRRYEPKSHNLSFDQKLFIDALGVKGIKILGKKDAAKIVKRLKLLFPDELKLIKDTADEIAHKVQL